MLKLVHDAGGCVDAVGELPVVDLDELCRVAAQQMLAAALLAERQAYLDDHADVVDAAGCRMVVGNGYLPEREVTTGAVLIDGQHQESNPNPTQGESVAA